MNRFLALTAVAATLMLPANSSAAEDPGCVREALAAQSAFGATSTCVSSGSGNTSDPISSGASDITFTTEPVCDRGSGANSDAYYGCGEQATCGNNGLEYWVWRHSNSGSGIIGATCVEPGEAAPADVLTPGRILEAFRRVDLPEAPLEVQPPGGVTLVNFDTILRTDAQPFTETVQLLNRQITFDIEPSEFTWTLGDGRTLTTTDPGRAWRAGLPMNEYVSHRYAEAGTVRLQLTTTWSARWRLPNGPWRPVAGTVDIASPAQDLEVTTARPQLVSYD